MSNTTLTKSTQHLDEAIAAFIRGEMPKGFKFNAQPIDLRMDVFEVTPSKTYAYSDRRATFTVRNLRTGDIEMIYDHIPMNFNTIKKIVVDWLTAVETVHGVSCFERHVAWKNGVNGGINLYADVSSLLSVFVE